MVVGCAGVLMAGDGDGDGDGDDLLGQKRAVRLEVNIIQLKPVIVHASGAPAAPRPGSWPVNVKLRRH